MQRPMSVYGPIGVDNAATRLEPFRSMLNRRQRREFEQKAAKETKGGFGGGSQSWSSGRAFGASSIVLIVLAESPCHGSKLKQPAKVEMTQPVESA
jgi:hypothetical protein